MSYDRQLCWIHLLHHYPPLLRLWFHRFSWTSVDLCKVSMRFIRHTSWPRPHHEDLDDLLVGQCFHLDGFPRMIPIQDECHVSKFEECQISKCLTNFTMPKCDKMCLLQKLHNFNCFFLQSKPVNSSASFQDSPRFPKFSKNPSAFPALPRYSKVNPGLVTVTNAPALSGAYRVSKRPVPSWPLAPLPQT